VVARQEVGAALRAALEERGCALGAAEARALSVLLIDLIAERLIAPDHGAEAVHSLRALQSAGAVVGLGGLETVPAYNMGQSVCIDGED